jgi:hypothetical protein
MLQYRVYIASSGAWWLMALTTKMLDTILRTAATVDPGPIAVHQVTSGNVRFYTGADGKYSSVAARWRKPIASEYVPDTLQHAVQSWDGSRWHLVAVVRGTPSEHYLNEVMRALRVPEKTTYLTWQNQFRRPVESRLVAV